jgi:hypothetical protein
MELSEGQLVESLEGEIEVLKERGLETLFLFPVPFPGPVPVEKWMLFRENGLLRESAIALLVYGQDGIWRVFKDRVVDPGPPFELEGE